MAKGLVYLLHFSEPYKHAKHYTGFTGNLKQRLEQHKTGKGARLTQVVTESGRQLRLARVWKGATRNTERAIKNQKNAPRLCWICKELKKAMKEGA